MDISVIVCCYNSADVISDTLEKLANQKIPKNFGYEVILVNNNSSDNTTQIALKIWSEYNSPAQLYIVNESRQGLAYARKTGVFKAKSELLVFCDDDNWLSEHYLYKAFGFMSSHKNVGALGGQSEAVLQGPQPPWWKDKALGYAVGKQSEASGDVTKRGYLWGAGLVIRKCILTNLYNAGFSSELVGRSGKSISSGDDSEMTKWVILMGYNLWYLEDLTFKHYIIKSRLKDSYMIKMFKGHKEAKSLLRWYDVLIDELCDKPYTNRKNNLPIGFLKYIKSKFNNNEYTLVLSQIKLGTFIKVHSMVYKLLCIYQKLNKM